MFIRFKNVILYVTVVLVSIMIGMGSARWLFSNPVPNVHLNNQADNFYFVNHHTNLDNQYGKQRINELKDKFENNHQNNNINVNSGVQEELHLINQDRIQHHLSPVALKSNLNQIAQIRAKQAFFVERFENKYDDKDVHEEMNNDRISEEEILLKNSGIHFNNYGENVCSVNLNHCKYNNGKRGIVKYNHIKNIEQMAKVVNNNSMYHDQSNGNGHRNNILNPNYNKVGIGVYYQPTVHQAIFVEDFIG